MPGLAGRCAQIPEPQHTAQGEGEKPCTTKCSFKAPPRPSLLTNEAHSTPAREVVTIVWMAKQRLREANGLVFRGAEHPAAPLNFSGRSDALESQVISNVADTTQGMGGSASVSPQDAPGPFCSNATPSELLAIFNGNTLEMPGPGYITRHVYEDPMPQALSLVHGRDFHTHSPRSPFSSSLQAHALGKTRALLWLSPKHGSDGPSPLWLCSKYSCLRSVCKTKGAWLHRC